MGSWRHASRSTGGPPPHPAAQGARHRRGGRRGAGGVRAHGPARPRGPVDGGGAGLLPAGPQRWLAAARRRPHRPQRPHRRRGSGAVPVACPASATPEVRTALRKLVRALPEPMRDEAEAASNAVVLADGWGGSRRAVATPAHLPAIQRAVVEGVQVELVYVAGDGARSERTLHPLGLAARGSTWYLMADTAAGLRTFRVDRVVDV